MRITTYNLENVNGKATLVKESSRNYPKANALVQPDIVVKMMNDVCKANRKAEEYVWLLALDIKAHLIGMFEVTHGTVNCSLISPREIFVRLCLCGAVTCIVVHNHPSGDIKPSMEDMKTTRQIKSAGELMCINLLDHIIIGDNSYYSFREHNNVIE